MTIKNCSGFHDFTNLIFDGNMVDKPEQQKIQLAFNAIRGSWQTFGDSSQFSWPCWRKDGEGMELILICLVHILHIYVSCHNWYFCLVTSAPPPGGEQGGARGRRRCRQLGPGTFPSEKNKVKFFDPPKILATFTFRVKNRSNFLTRPKLWQLCSEAEGWCSSRGKGGRKSWSVRE